MRKVFGFALVLLPLLGVAAFVFQGAASRNGELPGLTADGKLAACPDTPNCVSSDGDNPEQTVEPLSFDPASLTAEQAWQKAREAVESLPGAKIVTSDGDYLGAECSSRVFGFVDDLELQLRPGQSEIAVRSASRVGHSDLGANRKRVGLLREQFETSANQ